MIWGRCSMRRFPGCPSGFARRSSYVNLKERRTRRPPGYWACRRVPCCRGWPAPGTLATATDSTRDRAGRRRRGDRGRAGAGLRGCDQRNASHDSCQSGGDFQPGLNGGGRSDSRHELDQIQTGGVRFRRADAVRRRRYLSATAGALKPSPSRQPSQPRSRRNRLPISIGCKAPG